MTNSRLRKILAAIAAVSWFAFEALPSCGAFHLWQVREAFTNADGSVQFIEMFDSFAGETLMAGKTLTANSDGTIKTFTFPSDLTLPTDNHALLIATTGFGSLTGGVTPDFTFSQSTTPISGSFFDPNATNITITYNGSGDSMAVTGASLPKDGIKSLTDAGAFGLPPGTPNISAGVNSPTNLPGTTGLGVNLSNGDYNGNHSVDAADYPLWRETPANFGADAAGYGAWRSNFGNAAGLGAGIVPEPAAPALLLFGFLCGKLLIGRRL